MKKIRLLIVGYASEIDDLVDLKEGIKIRAYKPFAVGHGSPYSGMMTT